MTADDRAAVKLAAERVIEVLEEHVQHYGCTADPPGYNYDTLLVANTLLAALPVLEAAEQAAGVLVDAQNGVITSTVAVLRADRILRDALAAHRALAAGDGGAVTRPSG